MDPGRRIRVLLADDHRLFLDGLQSLLSEKSDLDVVATTTDGGEAVRLARAQCPDVAILDLSVPRLNGLEATRRIVLDCPRTGVICLTTHGGSEFVTRALERGASGYLLKDCAPEELLDAIRCVADGRKYLAPSVAGAAVDALLARRGVAPSGVGSLTSRETQVLRLIAQGHPSREIARQLGLSIKTVASHRANLTGKLGVQGEAGLTRFALRHGIVEDYPGTAEDRPGG